MFTMRKLVSPNCDDRAGGVKPSFLILHYTGTITGQEAEDYYMNAKTHAASGPISPHYMIDLDGAVTQFVDENKRAWHAGRSWWEGHVDMNSHSIGIEMVNPGHDRGYVPFTKEQMQSLSYLAKGILSRHDIPPHRVLGHSDIAPTRKPDPGELMDWFWLATHGIGLWPQPEQMNYDLSEIILEDEVSLRNAFTEFGYDPNVALNEIVRAFQRHFQPELFKQPDLPLTADRETAARLHWLLNRKNAYKT